MDAPLRNICRIFANGINMRNPKSLRTVYISLFVIAIILTVSITSVTFYYVMQKQAISRAYQEDTWLLLQLCKGAEYVAESAENVSASLAFDMDLQTMMIKYEYEDETPSDITNVRYMINNSLVDKGRFNKAIYDCKNIVLFSNDGKVLGSKETFDINATLDEYRWADFVANSNGKAIWLPLSSDDNSPSTRNGLYLAIVRKVFSAQSSDRNTFEETLTLGKGLGYLLVYFDYTMFSDIVSEYADSAKIFYLVDDNNTIISSQDYENIGNRFNPTPSNHNGYVVIDGEEYLMTEQRIEEQGWTYICLTRRAVIERANIEILGLSIFLALLLIVVFIALGLFLSRYTTGPIYHLISAFKMAEKGKIKISETSNIKEFDELFSSFNHSMDTIHNLASEVYSSELEKQELAISIKESRIQALQNQINPHFLYNTLDSINWRAKIDGNNDVSEMICTLGKFFRSNIRISENQIPLSQELENAKLYVQLSRYRFGDKLQYIEECSEELMDQKIIRLLIQPLIENSIKHGIEETGEDEIIKVAISEEDGNLVINIKDNGPGMDEETIDYLRNLWDTASDEYHKETRSVGLYNVFRRLALTYQNAVSVTILSKLGEGAEFIIRIKLEKTE